MKHINNVHTHLNDIKKVLKQREELYSYFLSRVEFNQLQSKADIRLFFKKPLLYFLRYIIYLPINLLRVLERANNKFYLIKMENEIEVLKDEISYMEKKIWKKY